MKKFIFGFISGGAIGSGITFLITKEFFRRKCEEEIEEYRLYYKNKYLGKTKARKEIEEKDTPPKRINMSKDEKAKNELLRGDYISGDTDLAELERPSEDAPDEYYDEDEAAIVEVNKNAEKEHEYDKAHRRKEPCIIPAASFGEAPGYDMKSYTYYTEDLTITDEDDKIVDDETYLFGTCLEDWKKDIGGESIFVRNFSIQTDFEITKFFGPYEP